MTANGWHERWSWGGQYLATLRTWKNEEDYRLGDVHQASSWVGYRFRPSFSGSIRLTAQHAGKIDGIDDDIVLPVQTADPHRQGGKTADLGIGINFAPQEGRVSGWRLAGEFSVPVYRNLNGPQLETDWYATIGLQKGF